MSHTVIIKGAVKRYGNFTALHGIDLTVNSGEFFTLLGPSGCGKTTLLRMIAGFNTIEEGTISFDDVVINAIEAHKRDIGMVFQNYAIFPHLTVYDNVAYGLRARKMRKEEVTPKVEKALELVHIKDLSNRRPSELSGGQQQRVALARAVVIEPGLLLMDEPLSNLDAKLRVQMRTVIKKLQRRLGITTIYVTHDQEEALAISDRIAVMKDGVIQQTGTPKEIYTHPAKPFVANFIGTSNFLSCIVNSAEEVKVEDTYLCSLPLAKNFKGKASISARPEHMYFTTSGLHGKIVLSTFLGDFINYEVQLDDGKIIQVNEYSQNMEELRPADSEVFVKFNPQKVSVYDQATEEVLS
ncbi:MAG: ABC transporter ATP-binding protein [Sphaerochaetaceae bacterium]